MTKGLVKKNIAMVQRGAFSLRRGLSRVKNAGFDHWCRSRIVGLRDGEKSDILDEERSFLWFTTDHIDAVLSSFDFMNNTKGLLFLKEFFLEGLRLSGGTPLDRLLTNHSGALADFIKEIFRVMQGLIAEEIETGDVLEAIKLRVKDAFVGDLMYLFEHYEMFWKISELPDGEVKELAQKTARAYQEVVVIVYLVKGLYDGAKAVAGRAKGAGGGLAKYGDSFGKAGTLVEHPGTKIDWSKVSKHGLQRMNERGVTQNMVEVWVKNGKVLEQTAGAKHLFFTPQGAAVVATDGTLITTIPVSMYDKAYKALSKALFGD